MKRSRMNLAAVAATLVAATQAFGGTTWEATSSSTIASSPSLDIDRVTVMENRSTYIVSMYLKGKPVSRDVDESYSIYVGPGNSLPGAISRRGTNYWIRVSTNPDLVPRLVDAAGSSKLPKFRAEFSGQTNRLEWVIEKRNFVTAPTQFFGVTEKGQQTVDRTSIGKIVGSPIPTAAWLVASGVLSLIGLKRKDVPTP